MAADGAGLPPFRGAIMPCHAMRWTYSCTLLIVRDVLKRLRVYILTRLRFCWHARCGRHQVVAVVACSACVDAVEDLSQGKSSVP